MWFRGVAASMGLCFNLGAVLEGHPDVFFAVNSYVQLFKYNRLQQLPLVYTYTRTKSKDRADRTGHT